MNTTDETPTNNTLTDSLLDQMIVERSAPAVPSVADDADDPNESHPMNVKLIAGLQLGWVDEYANIMTDLVDSPYEFNRLAALVAASTAIGRRAKLNMGYGTIYPNIFGVFAAPTSFYHKSATLSKVDQVLRRSDLSNLLFGSQLTPEGLVSQLQRSNTGVILNDEIGRVFDSHNTKYMRNFKPDLTDLFDCKPLKRTLAQNEITVEEPCLNILGGTTPTVFYESVTTGDWRSGFLARWLFVLPEGSPDLSRMPGEYTLENDRAMLNLAAKLRGLSRHDPTAFRFEGDAHNLWGEWYLRTKNEAYLFNDDIVTGFVTRYWTYALKFALILSAVNDSWGVITADTMQSSISLAENYKRFVYRLLEDSGRHRVSGGKLQKTFRVILQLAQKGERITKGKVQQYANMDRAQLQPVLERLIEVGAIAEEDTPRGKIYLAMVEKLPIRTA